MAAYSAAAINFAFYKRQLFSANPNLSATFMAVGAHFYRKIWQALNVIIKTPPFHHSRWFCLFPPPEEKLKN